MQEQTYQIQEALAELQSALLTKAPNMPTLLRTIHRQLKADPELVTILSDEDKSIIVNGMSVQTSTTIATKVAKKPRAKALSKVTASDL